MENKNKLIKALDSFKNKRIAVIGDFMLDEYVQVVKFQERKYVPGGAGNTARNISSLGAGVSVFWVAGKLANIAGRIVVQKPGTSFVSLEEIKGEVIG